MLKLISNEQFEMQGTNGRFIHCAEVHDSLKCRVYIFFYDMQTNKKYIEEVRGGSLIAIEDDSRWNELLMFGSSHNLFPAVISKNIPPKPING